MPVALVAAVPILAVARHEAATGIIEPELRRTGRPHLWANLALAMVSAAIAAALFLLVLLLIEGWRLSPIGAAIVVIGDAAGGARSAAGSARSCPSARARAAAGAILVSGGLGGLALLPKAEVALTVPPQILVGIGLSLVLSALTETALGGRAPQAIHGGWTISARHAGVVIGLLALTPIFTHDIAAAAPRRDQRRHRRDPRLAGRPAAEDRPGAEDRRPPRRREGQGADDRPRLRTAARRPAANAPKWSQLRDELQDQLDRGATHAFSPSFGLAALLGLLALIPIGLSRRVEL